MTRFLAAKVVLLAVALVSGCSTASKQTETSSNRLSENVLTGELAIFLAEAPADAAQRFAHTPWADDTLVRAQVAYHAASGRICRELHVQPETAYHQVFLACQASPEQWVLSRPVTRLNGGVL